MNKICKVEIGFVGLVVVPNFLRAHLHVSGAYKRLAFQPLSAALQTANARMLRERKALVSLHFLLPLLPGSAN
jgi:hypothetical protein